MVAIIGMKLNGGKELRIAGGCIVAALVFCGLPLYCFFLHCPDPSPAFIAAKRTIHVGMSYEEARSLMPGKVFAHPDEAMAEDFGDLGNAPPATDDRGFTGHLTTIEACSVQCHRELRVRVQNGLVVQVILEVYNDLGHSTREVQ